MNINTYNEQKDFEYKFSLLKEIVDAIINGTNQFRRNTLYKITGVNVSNFMFVNGCMTEKNIRRIIAKRLRFKTPKISDMTLHIIKNGVAIEENYNQQERLYLYLEMVDLRRKYSNTDRMISVQ